MFKILHHDDSRSGKVFSVESKSLEQIPHFGLLVLMSLNTPPTHLDLLVRIIVALMASVPFTHASTVWTGPLTNYTQPAQQDPTLAADQDRLTAHVWLTRASSSGLFNAVNESSYDQGSDQDPTGTEWAVGSLANFASLSYGTWAQAGGGHPVLNLVGQQLVLHLIGDDIYLSVKFTQLGGHGAGGFAYVRSTPAVSLPAPTVTITNPVNGAAFTAPASVSVSASASVSSGTITNAAFFGKTNNVTIALGVSHSAPFTITAANLGAGNYSLTAVATADGISATSAVVNITVNLPAPTVSITNPAPGAVFSAPANLRLEATTAVSSGTVTNVAFFAGATAVGSAQAVPFTTPSPCFAAGSSSLPSLAPPAGISTTSAVVNVSVVAPVAVSNSVPVVAGSHFSFNYSANVGLTYLIQRSTDLINWSSIFTNVASSNPVHFTDNAMVAGANYYRVARQPNP
jgi:hypothetical protein